MLALEVQQPLTPPGWVLSMKQEGAVMLSDELLRCLLLPVALVIERFAPGRALERAEVAHG